LCGGILVKGFLHPENFSEFNDQVKSAAIAWLLGMVFFIVGALLRRTGAGKFAASDVILSLPEIPPEASLPPDKRPKRNINNTTVVEKVVVKVRCPQCGHLNSEEANFCESCGIKQ
jgi:hypothetical protein